MTTTKHTTTVYVTGPTVGHDRKDITTRRTEVRDALHQWDNIIVIDPLRGPFDAPTDSTSEHLNHTPYYVTRVLHDITSSDVVLIDAAPGDTIDVELAREIGIAQALHRPIVVAGQLSALGAWHGTQAIFVTTDISSAIEAIGVW